jgi:paraquat-inducible protein B
VKINIDTSSFFDKNRPLRDGFYNLNSAVVKGLRARVSEDNPITKALFINLEFIKDIPTLPIIKTPKYLIFPSFKMKDNEIVSSITNILNMIENLPLENLLLSANKLIADTNEPFTNLIKELSQTNKAIKTLLKNKETQNITKELNITLKKLSELLISTKKITDGDSQKSIIAGQISMMLREITKASSSMTKFLNKIDKKPNSLIFGD